MPSLAEAVKKFAPQIELCIASEGPIQTAIRIDGIEYVSLGKAKRNRKIFPSLRHIRSEFKSAVVNCVKDFKPDVIHIHGSEGYFPTLSHDCWCGIPCAVSLQGIIAGYAPHYMGNITEQEFRPFRNIVREILQGYSTSNEAAYWRNNRGVKEIDALKSFRYIFGRTAWDKAWTKYINPDACYLEVGEVLRPEFYQQRRKPHEIVSHTIYCGAAATYPLKGAHWILRALAVLKKKYPDVKLIIARAPLISSSINFFQARRLGEYHRYLRSLISSLDLWGNVELLDGLAADAVADVLRRSEVFCLPSLVENSPNSLGEAMLMGVPAIATDVGGVKSILSDGNEGILVPSADPASIADSIDMLFSNRSQAIQYADAAYKTAVNRYNPQIVVQQLLAAYESMTSNEKSRPCNV